MTLFRGLIDEKTLKVLALFINNPEEYFHINKVSDDAKVPLATTFRIINSLKNNDIIEYRKISKFKIYRLANNQKTKKLRKVL
jgi:DNA-binding IclR family transcriptional regulator